MAKKTQFGYLVAILLLATPGYAQTLCQRQDTENSCKKKVEDSFNLELASLGAAAKTEIADKLAAVNTGLSQAASPESATSFSDFFSSLKAAADTGSTDDNQDDEAVGFEFTRCMREQTETSPLQCQARVRFGGAKLYDPLKQALAAETRDARASALEKGLDLGDSITVGVFFNLVSDSYGRVPRFATEKLFDDIWKEVSAQTSNAQPNETSNRYEDLRERITILLPTFKADTAFTEVAKLDSALATEAIAAREAAWRAEFESMAKMRDLLEQSGYFALVDLVNNQPQLNFGVSYTQNDELAGPDEWRAKFVWEVGLVNVNSARKFVYGDCRSEKNLTPVGCLQWYLARKDIQHRLKGGDRFALSLEAVQRRRYSVTLPVDQVSVMQDAERSLLGSVAYGFYVDFDRKGEPRSRIDIKGSYEDVSSDPNRQDRGTLAATYSQRVFGTTVLAVTLVYATKPEFRGDVDQELSGRVGLNYKWGKAGSL